MTLKIAPFPSELFFLQKPHAHTHLLSYVTTMILPGQTSNAAAMPKQWECFPTIEFLAE